MEKEKTIDELYLDKLLRERDDLDKMIELVNRKMGSTGSTISEKESSVFRKNKETIQVDHDTFYAMSIIDAAKKYLGIVGKPARPTQEIIKALKSGGLEKAEYNTVSSVLARADRSQQGICRVGRGKWGLSEWYPGTGRRLRPIPPEEESHEENKEE
jgi:hypothetical protein